MFVARRVRRVSPKKYGETIKDRLPMPRIHSLPKIMVGQ